MDAADVQATAQLFQRGANIYFSCLCIDRPPPFSMPATPGGPCLRWKCHSLTLAVNDGGCAGESVPSVRGSVGSVKECGSLITLERPHGVFRMPICEMRAGALIEQHHGLSLSLLRCRLVRRKRKRDLSEECPRHRSCLKNLPMQIFRTIGSETDSDASSSYKG
jgi:hypothetical protein